MTNQKVVPVTGASSGIGEATIRKNLRLETPTA